MQNLSFGRFCDGVCAAITSIQGERENAMKYFSKIITILALSFVTKPIINLKGGYFFDQPVTETVFKTLGAPTQIADVVFGSSVCFFSREHFFTKRGK